MVHGQNRINGDNGCMVKNINQSVSLVESTQLSTTT
jgi:hypothetical protein